MTLQDRKIPIITGVNDTPTTTGQPKHPNASLLCKQFNDLIDNELTLLDDIPSTTDDLSEGTTNLYHTTERVRQAITVTGNATYNSETGVISVNNANFSVDHISLTSTVGNTKTYTIWADSAETIDLGTFTVTDGINGIDGINGVNGADGQDGTDGTNGVDGQDGRGIEKVTSVDNGDGTKTITFWGDLAETINLGNFTLASGVDGQDGADGADGRGITNTSYNASTGVLTLTFSDSTTFDTGDLRGADGADGDVLLNNANVFTKAQRVATIALTDGATINVDASLSNVFSVTLGGNRTISNPTNLGAGQTIIFKIKQDATGTRTLTWGSAYKFPNGTAPTLSTGANKLDVVSCVSDGTNLYCNFVGGY